jgi:hypothetical protein
MRILHARVSATEAGAGRRRIPRPWLASLVAFGLITTARSHLHLSCHEGQCRAERDDGQGAVRCDIGRKRQHGRRSPDKRSRRAGSLDESPAGPRRCRDPVGSLQTYSNQNSDSFYTPPPRAITGSARRLLLSDTLTTASRTRLEKGMIVCKPGLDRIRAALRRTWVAGDQPGTSVEGETNDYAIARPPGRVSLLIATYPDAPSW